jgi:hypothetical protein
MMMMMSPGAGAARATGHRQQIGKSPALTEGPNSARSCNVRLVATRAEFPSDAVR